MKINKTIEETEIPQNIDTLPPLQQLAHFWPIIVAVLNLVKIFTGEKADAKIEQIIKWGEENL